MIIAHDSWSIQNILIMAKTALELVKGYHGRAFDYISKALEIDEDHQSNKQDAVEWYLKGIEQLELGLREKCMGASQEDKQKATRLQSKMQNNLTMARERLNKLLLSDDEDDSPSERKPKSNGTNVGPISTNVARPKRDAVPKYSVKKKATKVEERKPWNHGSSRPTPARPHSGPSRAVPKHDYGGGGVSNTTRSKINLKGVSKDMVNKILDDLIEPGSHSITLSDVAGQEVAKQALREIVILPALRPEFFTGLRTPARGLLLFGPPGTGKTLLAKAVAAEAKSNFFNISASSLTSKWVGDGEKMVRALFAVAKEIQPTVIFIDEIDSLLCERKEGESDAVRRLKTEFMMRFDGMESSSEDRILVMGATNRPQELDDAVLRRFPKRVYVGLPDAKARFDLLSMLLKKQNSPLSKTEMTKLAQQTELYSGSDLTELARDAALGPVREMTNDQITSIDICQLRPMKFQDFIHSLRKIRPSVSTKLLKVYDEWNSKYGDNSAL